MVQVYQTKLFVSQVCDKKSSCYKNESRTLKIKRDCMIIFSDGQVYGLGGAKHPGSASAAGTYFLTVVSPACPGGIWICECGEACDERVDQPCCFCLSKLSGHVAACRLCYMRWSRKNEDLS